MKLPRWLRWRSPRELDEEIAARLGFATTAAIERGLPPEEAAFAARRALGNSTRLKEQARERDPLLGFENIAKDVRYALRSLRRNPGFTTAAVLSLALGATAESVLRGVLASGAKVTLAGIAIGLAGALALTRYFGEFLDRVNLRDPAAFLGVAMFLLGVAIAACWAPARRAASVDPAVTLKYE